MTHLWRTARLFSITLCLMAAVAAELRHSLSLLLLQERNAGAAQRAAALTPNDETVYLQLAELDPDHRRRYLEMAVAQNPWDAQTRMSLGFLAEFNGHADEAQQDFRFAAAVDDRAAPAWALTNFYFQQKDWVSFNVWGARYRQSANGHVAGLYRLAWGRQPQVAALIREFSPLTCSELEQMDDFLGPHASSPEIVPVDVLLTRCWEKAAVRLVAADISRLLMEDHPNVAADLWNKLERNPYFSSNLSPRFGHNVLADVDLARQPGETGFEWQINRIPGVSVSKPGGDRHSLEFVFDGNEPEAATLLFQPVVLAAGTTYRLEAAVEASEEQQVGFGWRLVELSTGRTVAEAVRDVSGTPKDAASWALQAPASSRTLALVFTYVRPAGQLREEGKACLSAVRLFPAGEPSDR